jgi:phosphoribosyl 1,2-cyclic phosphate phosphodiesterase
MQCLRARLTRLDAVLITHNHVDHLYGLDDVRPYSAFKGKTLPVWGSEHTLNSIRTKFDYIWNAVQVGGGLPDISLNLADAPFTAAGLTIIPIPIKHGKLDILGYRIGSLAYMSDISALPDETLPLLENLDTMIISCVRRRPHNTHLNIAGAKRLHRLVRPRLTYLTHLTHYFTHRELAALMPSTIVPAHDTLVIPVRM